MKIKKNISVFLLVVLMFIGACQVQAEVYMNVTDMPNTVKMSKKQSKALEKKRKKEAITAEILRKEHQIYTIRRSRSLRASQRRTMIKELKQEMKELSKEYRKI